MDSLLDADRQVIRWLGQRLKALQEQSQLPVHAIAFWTTGALYVIIWALLCAFENQPEWMWWVVGAGMGAIASYVADNEPVSMLEEGIALTHFGLDARWALMRLVYTPLAIVLLLPLLLSGDYSGPFTALLLIEIALFSLMEYLQAFRLVDAENAVMTLKDILSAVAERVEKAQPGAGEDTPAA